MRNDDYVTGIRKCYKKTWDDLSDALRYTNLYIFGVGVKCGYLWERVRIPFSVAGVIDNDKRKQGKRLEDYCPVDCISPGNTVINGVNILDNIEKGDTVILIASQKHYDEIYEYLFQKGFTNLFILFKLEENYVNPDETKTGSFFENKYVSRYIKEKIDPHKILFIGFGTYSGHGKYITETILKKEAGVDIVWAVADIDEKVPECVRLVYWGNPKKYIYELETAKIVIYDNIIPEYTVKRSEQVHIFTKHWASVTLKKFYLGASTITDNTQNVNLWRKVFCSLDYVITGSAFDEDSCKKGLEFNGRFIRAGSPRSDAMFRFKEMRDKIGAKYKIPKGVKLLTYAPTYRYKKGVIGRHVPEAMNCEIDYLSIKNSLESRFGGEWVILLRLHPSVSHQAKEIEKESFVIDVSNHQDGEEIVAASDVLISDYSSIMFEPAFVKKPVFLFAPDREDYIDKEYDLLIDYDSLPFPIAETNEQLAEIIMNFDQKKYEEDVTAFISKYGVHEDGHASERAAKFIIKLIEERNEQQ